MKAVHVFCIAVIIFSTSILGGAGSESHQELVLKYEKSGTIGLHVVDIWGTNLWNDEVTKIVPVPVSVGDVVKWEWSASPEEIDHFKIGTGAKAFYENRIEMNDSGEHTMQKEDYMFNGYRSGDEIHFTWYFQFHRGYDPAEKNTLVSYHIEVYEAPKKIPSFQAIYALAGIILSSYVVIRKKNRKESCK